VHRLQIGDPKLCERRDNPVEARGYVRIMPRADSGPQVFEVELGDLVEEQLLAGLRPEPVRMRSAARRSVESDTRWRWPASSV
jgi:hypothetical protein